MADKQSAAFNPARDNVLRQIEEFENYVTLDVDVWTTQFRLLDRGREKDRWGTHLARIRSHMEADLVNIRKEIVEIFMQHGDYNTLSQQYREVVNALSLLRTAVKEASDDILEIFQIDEIEAADSDHDSNYESEDDTANANINADAADSNTDADTHISN